MEDWKEVTLQDVIEINPTESLKKGTIAKKIGMDILQPFTRAIPSYTLEQFSGGTKFKNGDTIMARITPCLENGKTSYVDILEENEIAYGSTEYIVFRAKENITDSKFIYYLVTSSEIRKPAIKSMVGSSGRQRVQTDVVANLTIHLPPLATQKKIAEVLSSLDDKIELNNKINANLEQQAQAIFKSWFVDIFSTETDITIGDLITFSNGKKRPIAEGNIPVYGGNGILDYTNESNAENCISIGRVGYYCGNCYYSKDKCWISDNSIKAISKEGNSQLFSYYLLKNADLPSRAIGSGQPLLTQGILSNIKIKKPEENLVFNFNKICEPIMESIMKNIEENKKLSNLRDTLLPKLMNGDAKI